MKFVAISSRVQIVFESLEPLCECPVCRHYFPMSEGYMDVDPPLPTTEPDLFCEPCGQAANALLLIEFTTAA